MRRLWHTIVGHRWERSCKLCRELRYHLAGCEVDLRCRCGETKPLDEGVA